MEYADLRRSSEAYMASPIYQNLLARARHARAALAEKQHSELSNYLQQRSQRPTAPHAAVPWGQKIEYKTTRINPWSFMLGHIDKGPHTLASPEPSMFETVRRPQSLDRGLFSSRNHNGPLGHERSYREGELMQMHRKSFVTDASGVTRSILTANPFYHIFRGGKWQEHQQIAV